MEYIPEHIQAEIARRSIASSDMLVTIYVMQQGEAVDPMLYITRNMLDPPFHVRVTKVRTEDPESYPNFTYLPGETISLRTLSAIRQVLIGECEHWPVMLVYEQEKNKPTTLETSTDRILSTGPNFTLQVILREKDAMDKKLIPWLKALLLT